MNLYIVEQLPVLDPSYYNNQIRELISQKVVNLIYTSLDLKQFANDCGIESPPFDWDPMEREKQKADLNAIYAFLYNISKSDFEYILDSFNQLKVYEEKKYGKFLTKELSIQSFEKYQNQKELFE
jgi:hypothetical protein